MVVSQVAKGLGGFPASDLHFSKVTGMGCAHWVPGTVVGQGHPGPRNLSQ